MNLYFFFTSVHLFIYLHVQTQVAPRRLLNSIIGMWEGSSLRPLLFITAMGLINGKSSMTRVLGEIVHLNRLALDVDNNRGSQEELGEWKGGV